MSDRTSFILVILSAIYMVWASNADAIYPAEGGFAYFPFVIVFQVSLGYLIFEGGRLLSNFLSKNKLSNSRG